MKLANTRGRIALLCAILLLVSLAIAPPLWHLPLGIAGWVVIRMSCPDVHRSLGHARRWLQLLIILLILGAVFAKSDTVSYGISWSKMGALSATTMVSRAFALVALTSIATSVLPLRTWIEKRKSPVARRVMDVVAVASNLVPVQLRALSVASANLEERRPGLRRLPQRLWLLAVHSALRAGMLAETVAFDMAVADHNAQPPQKESS